MNNDEKQRETKKWPVLFENEEGENIKNRRCKGGKEKEKSREEAR